MVNVVWIYRIRFMTMSNTISGFHWFVFVYLSQLSMVPDRDSILCWGIIQELKTTRKVKLCKETLLPTFCFLFSINQYTLQFQEFQCWKTAFHFENGPIYYCCPVDLTPRDVIWIKRWALAKVPPTFVLFLVECLYIYIFIYNSIGRSWQLRHVPFYICSLPEEIYEILMASWR